MNETMVQFFLEQSERYLRDNVRRLDGVEVAQASELIDDLLFELERQQNLHAFDD
jgi:hypothetical protein